MDETSFATSLANKILKRPSGDPDDDLAVLSRQLLRALESKWRPIKSAPSNGVMILVIGGRYRDPAIAAADGEFWNREKLVAAPTHWQPVPPPPSVEE